MLVIVNVCWPVAYYFMILFIDTNDSICSTRLRGQKIPSYLFVFMIVLIILLLDLGFCFMNYDSVLRSHDSFCHDRNVLFFCSTVFFSVLR